MHECEDTIAAHESRAVAVAVAASAPTVATLTRPTPVAGQHSPPGPGQHSSPPPSPPSELDTRAERTSSTPHTSSVVVRPHLGRIEWLAHLVPGMPVLSGTVKVIWRGRDHVRDSLQPSLSQTHDVGLEAHEHGQAIGGGSADRGPSSWADSITTAAFQTGEES